MNSPCLLVGLPLRPYKSKGKCDANVEGIDSSDGTFELMLIDSGVGGCGLIFMDSARRVKATLWIIGDRSLHG